MSFKLPETGGSRKIPLLSNIPTMGREDGVVLRRGGLGIREEKAISI